MKKTTKKLNIKKETVNTFAILTTNELVGIRGGKGETRVCPISGTTGSVLSACCDIIFQ